MMINRWFIGAFTTASLIGIVHCSSNSSSAELDITDNLITCRIPLDCMSAPEAICASGTPKCTGGYCIFTPTPGDTCMPPDVSFCNPGGHTECARTDGKYPPDASACGTKECVATNGTCGWTACVAPGGH